MDLAVLFLFYAALFQVADGAQAVASGMLRGLHDTSMPMLYAAVGYWGIGLPLGAGLAFWTDLRGSGIWIGLAAGLDRRRRPHDAALAPSRKPEPDDPEEIPHRIRGVR